MPDQEKSSVIQRNKTIRSMFSDWYMKVHDNPAGFMEFEHDQVKELIGDAFDRGRSVQTIQDVFAWAEGVEAAVNTEDLAHKVTDEEAILAGMVLAIQKQMPELKQELKQDYPEDAHSKMFKDLEEL